MSWIYRAKNGDATNEYQFLAPAATSVLASKFELVASTLTVSFDAACRRDAGDPSTVAAGTYYVDGSSAAVTAGLAREDSERLKRIDETLSAKDTISVPLYGMGSTVCKAILATVKLTLTKTIDEDVQLDPENAAKMYTTHDLPKGKHSKDAIAAACTHLQNELTKFGVPFGIDDFEIRAVSTTILWENIKLGKFILSGGTDAVIVPGRVDDASIIHQLRVVVEFKDEEKLKSTDSQCIGELLCGLATSEHLVLVVKTDLKTRFDFWTPKDGSYSVWRCSNMQKAMQHISQFLLNSSRLALFRELNMDLPELRAMKRVRTAYDGGVVEDMLNIIPDLPKEERLPYYVDMMYS